MTPGIGWKCIHRIPLGHSTQKIKEGCLGDFHDLTITNVADDNLIHGQINHVVVAHTGELAALSLITTTIYRRHQRPRLYIFCIAFYQTVQIPLYK
jgi:hypothetical protein